MMAKQKKTTITIAHRLSTIRHADIIAVVNRGKIAEKGNHDELMHARGIYFGLVQAQAGH
jgi:ABC-type multidrug transport system fused ATPase/permease subunit